MSYKGRVRNGVVVLDEGASLPEDTVVAVQPVGCNEPDQGPSWAEVFKDVVGSVDDWPEDMAENHDHYIHGTTKQ
jgi:hypothetical protein